MKYPQPASSILEFQKILPPDDQLVKTIIGFCNQKGGRLILGIDNDGTICGIAEELVYKILEHLDYVIYDSTCPQIRPLIHTQNIAGKIIIIIDISVGTNKPYYLKSEGLEKGTYIRLGRSTLRANTDIIQELQWESRGRKFDISPVYDATPQDLDTQKIIDFISSRAHAPTSVDLPEAMHAYSLITEEHGRQYPTVAGILLFGKQPQKFFSEALINCAHFKGVAGRDIIAFTRCEGTLMEQYTHALAFLQKQLQRSFSFKDTQRIEELEIPEVALREILINAIIHRNYHITGSIKINIFDNRVEILSPGEFPGPLTSNNLHLGLSYARNGAISKVLREAGYCEKLGTGFRLVFESYEERGLKAPQIIEGENFIKCILPRPSVDELLNKVHHASEDGRKILNLLELTTELSIGEIVTVLKIPRATIGRRLAQLLQENLIKKIGSGKGTKYLKNV